MHLKDHQPNYGTPTSKHIARSKRSSIPPPALKVLFYLHDNNESVKEYLLNRYTERMKNNCISG